MNSKNIAIRTTTKERLDKKTIQISSYLNQNSDDALKDLFYKCLNTAMFANANNLYSHISVKPNIDGAYHNVDIGIQDPFSNPIITLSTLDYQTKIKSEVKLKMENGEVLCTSLKPQIADEVNNMKILSAIILNPKEHINSVDVRIFNLENALKKGALGEALMKVNDNNSTLKQDKNGNPFRTFFLGAKVTQNNGKLVLAEPMSVTKDFELEAKQNMTQKPPVYNQPVVENDNSMKM